MTNNMTSCPRWLHFALVVKTRCVLNFQSVDLNWQETDENKGKALLAYYLEKSNQKDLTGHNTARTVISEMCRAQEMDDRDYVRVNEIKNAL